MGIDSQDSTDFDIFFREIPEGYIARVATEKGQAADRGRGLFEEAAADEWKATRGKIRGGREKPLFNLERVTPGWSSAFPMKTFWKRVSAKCINCGICTYLCPTCHCFDLCDLQPRGQGARFRCLDSCAFPDFTKMAVHNPREEKWRRYRQRVSHKFNFFYQNFQTIACVGCGRCVAHCPVNLDLRRGFVGGGPMNSIQTDMTPKSRKRTSTSRIRRRSSKSSPKPGIRKLSISNFIDPSLRETFSFRSGQFAEYSVFGEGEATFCISSSPTRLDHLEFSVKRVGRVTHALHHLNHGRHHRLSGALRKPLPPGQAQRKEPSIRRRGDRPGSAPVPHPQCPG